MPRNRKSNYFIITYSWRYSKMPYPKSKKRMEILKELNTGDPTDHYSEKIARLLKMSPVNCYRLLRSLEDEGLVKRTHLDKGTMVIYSLTKQGKDRLDGGKI